MIKYEVITMTLKRNHTGMDFWSSKIFDPLKFLQNLMSHDRIYPCPNCSNPLILVTSMMVTEFGNKMCWWQVPDVDDRFKMSVTDLINWKNTIITKKVANIRILSPTLLSPLIFDEQSIIYFLGLYKYVINLYNWSNIFIFSINLVNLFLCW